MNRSRILGPSGLPIASIDQVDIGEGQGARVALSETAVVEFPGVTLRMAPGKWLIVNEIDWERMILEAAVNLPQA